MIHAKVPNYLWPYAFRHAVYINNRLPTSILGKHTTPYIEMFHHTPDERHIKVFRCDAYALIQHARKHSARAHKGIYVGQSDNTTGYLFYNPSTRTVIPTNHIRFNEDVNVDREWTTEDEEMLVKEAIISDSTHSHPSGSLYSAAPPAAVAPPTTTMHPTTSSMSKQDDSDDENKPLEVTHSPSSQHDAPVTSTHNLSTPITKVKKVIDTSLHTTKSTRSGRAYVAHTQGALVTGEHYIRDETTPM
jgi:hypothetical protein